MNILAVSPAQQFAANLHIISIIPSATPLKKPSNIFYQFHFLSLCRFQQLTMPSRLTLVSVSLLLAAPAVAFWLWLVIVPARVAILCPEGCLCDPGGYYVQCSRNSLTAIPITHLTDVRVLWLPRNNITLLEKNSFVSMTELEVLIAMGFGLTDIELGAFNGLTNLKQLLLGFNRIRTILPGTFECMNILENLELNTNSLDHLGNGVFSGLLNLKYIDLSGNELQHIKPDSFLGSPNLQTLKLDLNFGLEIPTNRNFIISNSLSNLHLSNCFIPSVSVETFANVSALEVLHLSSNYLRNLDINILKALPKLYSIYLDGNPLQCDCRLQEVWRWCKVHEIFTGTEVYAPHCYSKREEKKMCWGVLEKWQCSEGNTEYFGEYENENCSYKYTRKLLDDVKNSYGSFDGMFLQKDQVPIYVFPFVFGTTANVILLIIIISNKNMRTVRNMYILHLAVSDIIYLIVLFSEACVSTNVFELSGPEFTCTIITFFRRLSVGLSAYSVALYSIQRYRVTVNPLQVRLSSPPRRRNIAATFCGVWIVAALFAVPSTLSRYMCSTYLSTTIAYYKHVVIFELLVSCVLPLCVIAFTYTMTARILVESSRSLSEGIQNPKQKTRRFTAKIVLGLTAVFVISYVPYHVFWTYFICRQKNIYFLFLATTFNVTHLEFQYTYLISNSFLLINPCLNPVALICTGSQFRQHLKRYLTCFCKTSSPSTDFELARRN